MDKVKVMKRHDCLTDFRGAGQNSRYVFEQGPQDLTYQQIVSNSFSNDGFTCTFNPPSQRTCIDRNMLLRCSFNLKFTRPGGGGSSPLLELGSNDAFRSFAMSKCIRTVQLEIDDGSTTLQTRDMVYGFERFLNNDVLKNELGDCLSYPDQYQSYVQYQQYGSSRNALGNFGETGTGNADLRGGYTRFTVLSNNNNDAEVDVEFTEPLWVSPTMFKSGCAKGLTLVNQLNVIVSFAELSKNLFSHATTKGAFTGGQDIGVPIVSVGSTTYKNPALLILQSNIQQTQQLPSTILYDYNDFQVNSQNQTQTITAGASNGIAVSQTIQLSSTPKYLMCYLRKSRATSTISDPDVFASIDSVSLQFNSRNGLFANASKEQLYNIAVKNGYQGSYSAWSKYSGSVLMFQYGSDIPLGPDDAPGKTGQNQIQLTINYSNPNEFDNINYDLYIINIKAGVIVKQPGSTTVLSSLLSADDILNAPMIPESMDVIRDDFMRGGSILDSIKSGIKRIAPHAQKALEVGKTALPLIESALPLLLALGYNEDEAKRMIKHKEMSGGRAVSRKKLMDKMSKY